ncbi:MAG: hypothetical protein E7474_10630 [Ruminococcaceae bacterium]|nr:hypothetical protein [Oscillospiraceae bacterium]
MALNTPKKSSGIFAGLENLSGEETAAKSESKTAGKIEEPVAPEKPEQTEPAAPQPSAVKPVNPTPDGARTMASEPRNTPPAVAASIMQSVDPAAFGSGVVSGAHPSEYGREGVGYAQPTYYQQPPYAPINMVPPMYTIDRRYKRKPKSFRTCIALTEELHMAIEAAKDSGRIVSLNDLINTLLCQYFNLEK